MCHSRRARVTRARTDIVVLLNRHDGWWCPFICFGCAAALDQLVFNNLDSLERNFCSNSKCWIHSPFLDVDLHLTHWADRDDARVHPARLRSTVALAVPGTRSFAVTSCGSIRMSCLAATCNLPEEEHATVALVKLQLLLVVLHSSFWRWLQEILTFFFAAFFFSGPFRSYLILHTTLIVHRHLCFHLV